MQSVLPADEHATPSPYKLLNSQTKTKIEEGKRRVGRGQKQGIATQDRGKAINLMRLRSSDSDFQNVDEKVQVQDPPT